MASRSAAQDRVRRALKAAAVRLPDLFAPGSKLVVGFSGGQDSTCLLHALVHSRRGLHVTAAHVDHALRADSAESARRVADSAAALGAACAVRRVDVGAYRASLPGWSVQQAARAARYQALASVVREQSAAALLVAHTADDQAETLLLNLVRGAGLQGLSGMRLEEVIDVRRLGPPAPGLGAGSEILRLARPLLKVPRANTLAYCTQLGLTIVEDASNQTRTFTRNRVRLDLLPALETFNPAIRSVLARAADLVAEDVAALEAIVAELDASLRRDHRYDLRRWRAQPRALQRRLLRRGIESLVGELTDVRAAPVDDALDVLQTGQAKQAYHLPYGVEMIVERDTFSLRLHGRARHRARPNTWEVEAPRV